MAKLSEDKYSPEEIESMVEVFAKKLEVLRVRYEQYFVGVEKAPPSVLRMDVVRTMRALEQINIRNTALRFRLRTTMQKFTSYSTYWNRTLREIEDGTYKRHVDRARREQAAKAGQAQPKPEHIQMHREEAAKPETPQASKTVEDVADEAKAFLDSLGMGARTEPAGQPAKPSDSASRPPIVQPALRPTTTSRPPIIEPTLRPLSSADRPSIVEPTLRPLSSSASRSPIVQPALRPTTTSRPPIVPAKSSLIVQPEQNAPDNDDDANV